MRKRGRTWQLRVYLGVDPATGRKRYKSITVRGTKKEAEAALNRLVAEVERGAWADAGKLTVGEYLRRWFDTHAPKLAPSTQRRYRVALEMHLIPGLGHLPLSKLSPAHIEEFLTRDRAQRRDRKTGELSSSTALYHYRVLHKAMEQALRWGLIARNPCDAVEPPRRTATRFPTLGEEQARAVLKAVAGTNVHMPVLLALATGMRLGEILALRWEDVDLENGIISVRQTLYCPKKASSCLNPQRARQAAGP